MKSSRGYRKGVCQPRYSIEQVDRISSSSSCESSPAKPLDQESDCFDVTKTEPPLFNQKINHDTERIKSGSSSPCPLKSAHAYKKNDDEPSWGQRVMQWSHDSDALAAKTCEAEELNKNNVTPTSARKKKKRKRMTDGLAGKFSRILEIQKSERSVYIHKLSKFTDCSLQTMQTSLKLQVMFAIDIPNNSKQWIYTNCIQTDGIFYDEEHAIQKGSTVCLLIDKDIAMEDWSPGAVLILGEKYHCTYIESRGCLVIVLPHMIAKVNAA